MIFFVPMRCGGSVGFLNRARYELEPVLMDNFMLTNERWVFHELLSWIPHEQLSVHLKFQHYS